jgi:cobalt-zinc-cadmium efflux system outer membrane protein
LIEILRTREREGEGSRFDRIRAEQEVRELNQLLTAANVSLIEARTVLFEMLPPGVTFTSIAASSASPVEVLIPLETLLTRGSSTRAELRALQRSSERATLEAEAARRARRPTPSVFGGVKRADDAQGRDTGGVFGVTVALPFFDSGQREAARWEAERARVDAERLAVQERIRSEIVGASEVLAIRQAALQQEQQGSADELVQIAQVAYREGEVGILELLDAARTAARARNRIIDLQLTTRLAQIAVERAVGDTLWP